MATDTFAGKQGVRWRRATTWVGVLLTVTALASSAAAQQNQTETAGEWARLHGGIELSVTRIADERASFVAPHVGWTLPHEIVLGMALVVPAEDVPVRRTPAAEHTLRLVLGRVLAGYGFDVAGPLAARAGVSFGAGVIAAAPRRWSSSGGPLRSQVSR